MEQTGPFAAVPRPPRVPWVNPDRRPHVIGSAIVAALVLLGAGFGIGYAAAPSDHGRYGPQHMQPGMQFQPGQGGIAPGRIGKFPGPGKQRPGGPGNAPFPASSTPVAPSTPAAPSSTG
jgi:hypothetical protein